MEKISVKAARLTDAIGKNVLVRGWIRTRRDSKGGISFIELSDGSSLASLHIVADGSLPTYEPEVKDLKAGRGMSGEGEGQRSGGRWEGRGAGGGWGRGSGLGGGGGR